MDGINFTRTVGNEAAPLLRNSNRLDELVTTRDIELLGVPVRVYEPRVQASKRNIKRLSPGMVYYHGGGWTIGNIGKSCNLIISYLRH